MKRSLKKIIILLMTVVVLWTAMLCWSWGDSTSSAKWVSDSPDGKYRCAVFSHTETWLGGDVHYEIGLFASWWPHRELPGSRLQVSHGSVSCSDFQAKWTGSGEDIDFNTGYGDKRETHKGQVVDGNQVWN
jgi:hypothetical protein